MLSLTNKDAMKPVATSSHSFSISRILAESSGNEEPKKNEKMRLPGENEEMSSAQLWLTAAHPLQSDDYLRMMQTRHPAFMSGLPWLAHPHLMHTLASHGR